MASVPNALMDSGTFCRFSARRVAVTTIVSSPPEVWADAVPATASVAEIAAASPRESRPGVSRLGSDMRLSPCCSVNTNPRSAHGQNTVRRETVFVGRAIRVRWPRSKHDGDIPAQEPTGKIFHRRERPRHVEAGIHPGLVPLDNGLVRDRRDVPEPDQLRPVVVGAFAR